MRFAPGVLNAPITVADVIVGAMVGALAYEYARRRLREAHATELREAAQIRATAQRDTVHALTGGAARPDAQQAITGAVAAGWPPALVEALTRTEPLAEGVRAALGSLTPPPAASTAHGRAAVKRTAAKRTG